jgi:hypothetical protein
MRGGGEDRSGARWWQGHHCLVRQWINEGGGDEVRVLDYRGGVAPTRL